MKKISIFFVTVFIHLSVHATEVTPEVARAIAREAYLYGFPIVDNMRVQHAYFYDEKSPEFKARYNTLRNIPRVFTPEDRAIQTPNSDTPYSMLGMELRAEPMVITVPPIPNDRYWSIQLIDLYTHNFAYLGSRSTGNGGGSFLIAGPDWQGETPQGITKVIHSESTNVFATYRTQLINPADLQNVKAIQDQYQAKPLSQFLGTPAPPAPPPINFPTPLTPESQKTSLEFFRLLNFYLQFSLTHPSEKELMERFARIGVGTGKDFDPESLSPEIKNAIQQGMADAWIAFDAFLQQVNTGKVTSGEIFGTREFLKNNYLYRMAAAVLGIYGNSREEAMYPTYFIDSEGRKIDGSRSYTLRFGPGEVPPVNSFWSLTMYEEPGKLLVANPINRYLINSPMLPQFSKDEDGGITLIIQNESPGKEKEANWLPAPKGPFSMVMRLYWPKQEALNGTWKQPMLIGSDPALRATSSTGSVNTRIGPLDFELGLPSEESVDHLFDEVDFQRACQAFPWAMPIVNIGEWQRAHEVDFGAKDGDIVVYDTYQANLRHKPIESLLPSAPTSSPFG